LKILTFAVVFGTNAATITIKACVTKGVKFFLVGLPENAVKESQKSNGSVLRIAGYKLPKQKIIINMAPADIRKKGSVYDLPLAIGVLAA
jgi:magnesium chelatase family protein